MKPGESFIGQPIRSLQTMLRVIAEQDPRHPSIIPDGIYGPETITAVSAFQRSHGLPVTGVTDEDTWDAIVDAHLLASIQLEPAQCVEVILNPNQVIRKGERHAAVPIAQGMLLVMSQVYPGISRPGITGVLDNATADALETFQQLHDLPMTGQLDKRTWKQLALHYPLAANRYPNDTVNY